MSPESAVHARESVGLDNCRGVVMRDSTSRRGVSALRTYFEILLLQARKHDLQDFRWHMHCTGLCVCLLCNELCRASHAIKDTAKNVIEVEYVSLGIYCRTFDQMPTARDSKVTKPLLDVMRKR